MPNTLKIKRGTNATIPQGQLAEPLFTTDTYDLYIGKGAGGNQRIQNYIASGTSSQFLKGDGSLDSTTYQATSEKGQNNGYASLDAGGKIPAAQLPSSVIEYKGTWNASTNTPTLADGTGDAGDVYIVSVGGTQNLGSGSITFDAGDWVMYNGSIWQKSTGSNAVASVNGQTGIVVLTTTNINEGTNLYFTNSRARTAISLTTTGTSGAATYDNTTGVLNIPQYQSVLTNPITGTGTSGQVAYFNGTTSITSNSALTWNNSLGILYVTGTGNGYVSLNKGTASNTGFIDFYNSAGVRTGYIGYSTAANTIDYNANFHIFNANYNTNTPLISLNQTNATAFSYMPFVQALAPNITNGSILTVISGGKATSANNNIVISYLHNSDGSTSNRGSLGVAGSGNIFNWFASGNVAINTTTDSGYKLDVNGTARVQSDLIVNGSLGVGTTSLTGYNLRVSKNLTGSTSTTGIQSAGAIQSDVTSDAQYFSSGASTAAAAFTVTDLAHFIANQGTFGAGSTVTKQYGFRVAASLTGATNNYAFFSDIASGANRWNLYMNGTANNFMAGSLGIGATSLVGRSLSVTKNITGAVTSYGIISNGQIQSDATSSVRLFNSVANTAAASFTLSSLVHYYTEQVAFGAGSAVTNQYGFYAESNLTGATNNYGFFGNIASGTNRWNLYMAGTAANYLAGSLNIGTTSVLSDYPLNVQGTVNGNLLMRFANTSSGTSARLGLILNTDFGTLGSLDAYGTAYNIGSTDDIANGVRLFASGAGGLSLRASNASGTIRFYNGSTESARFGTNGALGIGSTSLSIFGLRLSKTITGGTIAYGQFADGAIQSDVTSEAMYYSTNATTAASAFTLTNLFHFRARYNTFGATSAVTNQYGFYVDSALTAATNNFGFYGNIASGANRWNLYMAGTAANYLAGKLLIGSTTDSGEQLQVTGTAKVTGAATFSSSVTANSLALNGSIANSGDAATLTIKQSSTTYTNGIYLERGGERNGYYMYIGGSADSLTFRRNYFGTQSDVMSLTRDGNVGIGTTSPVGALQVSNGTIGTNLQSHVVNITGNNYSNATIGVYDAATLAANTGGGINFGAFYTGTTFTEFAYIRTNKDNATSGDYGGSLIFATRPNGGSTTERMRITSGGLVTVNDTYTSTNYKFAVKGASFLTGSNNKGLFITDTATFASIVGLNKEISAYNPIEIRASGTDYQLYLTTGGEVLINTATDSGDYKLQVNGNVYATAYFESSDIRLKDVLTNSYSENFSAIEFMWKDKRDDKKHWGYAAQDVMKYIPDAIEVNNDGMMTVNYNEAHTWKIAQLEAKIVELEAKLK